jgi:hypothetical protein
MNPTGICYNTPGIYDVTLITYNSLGSDTLLLPNYMTVYPFPPPIGITMSGDTLTANGGFISYQWYLNFSVIAGATDSFYVATQSGIYSVAAFDSNGCEVETTLNVVLDVPVVERSGLMVYPNPVAKDLHIGTLPGFTLQQGFSSFEIVIYNALGEKVYLRQESNLPQSIDCSRLVSGIYQLHITGNSRIYRVTFIRQ